MTVVTRSKTRRAAQESSARHTRQEAFPSGRRPSSIALPQGTADSRSSRRDRNGPSSDSTARGTSRSSPPPAEEGPKKEENDIEEPSISPSSSSRSHPPKTPDGRYIIVNNRRWRATDPSIPEHVLTELKHYLAVGRSGVRQANAEARRRGGGGGGMRADESSRAVRLARKRTGLAKLGLGERGKPEWWNADLAARTQRWEKALEELRRLDGGGEQEDDDDDYHSG